LPHNLDEQLVDTEQSYWWLKSGDIKGETESTIVALKTKQLIQTILKEEIDSKCRLHKQHEETTDHPT
jgi:hypothetical protein